MTSRLEELKAYESRRAEKTAQLFDLLNDEDLVDLVAKILGSEQLRPANTQTPILGVAQPERLRDVIRTLPLPPEFTTVHVRSLLEARGYSFGKADPKAAIRDALYMLSRPGPGQFLHVARQGQGGGLNVYERVTENQEPAEADS